MSNLSTHIADKPWKLLIVDDEPAIHDITILALEDLTLDGHEIEFYHAYSAAEAKEILEKTQHVGLALIDVVMETEDAGLQLVNWIRADLEDRNMRIILRTGQPGQAPIRDIIRSYDINDYREKTDLHINALRALTLGSFRSYRDIVSSSGNA